MESSRLLASVDVALEKLQYRRKQRVIHSAEMKLEIMIRGLRVVRTFLLCSTQSTEENNFTPCSQKQKQDISRMGEDLRSLLIRVEDVVRKILDDPTESCDCRYDMESCEDEMDSWYTSYSAYLKKYSTSPFTNQIKAILNSVLENLYMISERTYGFYLKEQLQQIEALKRNITAMRRIICFCSLLLCTENLLTHIEPLAISAAHLTLCVFSVKGPIPKDVITFMVSALLLKMNHALNPLLHENYTLALASLKLYDSTLFIVKMERCIVTLSSDIWEMLQLVTRVSLKELELYDRLGLLRILLKRQPDIFDDDKIWDLTAATVYDAGVRIFSLGLKDLVNDQSFQDNDKVIWADVLEGKLEETSRLCKTNVLGFIDFLLENFLMEVNSSLSCVPKIRKHLDFLKSFMGKLLKLRKQQENLHQDVWNLGVQIAYKIEFLIDQLVLGDVLDSFSMSLQSITENIMTIEADFSNIINGVGRQEIQQITCPSADKATMNLLVSNVVKWSISSSDEVVGFESEKKSIVDRLVAGFQKLQVVAVVGMAGLGKTTLATNVYTDSSVTHHFHVKAWCSISQVFDRRKVLLELLNQIQPEKSHSAMDENDLSQKLWRSLKRRRYLIFIDDVWDTKAFDLLKESLPDDSNQSRILLTSRHSDVVPDDNPLFLRHLTLDESLEILRRKLFPAEKDWPLELREFAKLCKGLPLTVVIVAGLLRTTDPKDWKDVVKTLRSSIISDLTDQCESTIELSYNHLPDHLKPCFLWFGAFPEDHKYSVKKMIWLWISEGLVRKNESKSLEDVGRDYMNNLIARSLVMNGERRTVGGAKTCGIHDLLHDFCKRKANEEHFLHVLEQGGSSSGEYETLLIDETEIFSVELRNLRRLCMYSKPERLNWKVFCPRLRSLLFFSPTERDQRLDPSYILGMFKLLRVLGIDKVRLTGFSSEIGALVQLRYLAIRVDGYVDPAIGNLSNLETLVLTAAGVQSVVSLPDTFWNLRKLRHLYTVDESQKKFYVDFTRYELPIDDSRSSRELLELQTLSTLCVTDGSVLQKQLRKFPNIRQLRCVFDVDEVDSKLLDLSFVSRLESLSIICVRYGNSLCGGDLFLPENIKKLTLWGIGIPKNKAASIAKLPHLEVLKLLFTSFHGNKWHVEEEAFPNLKFLELEQLELVDWTADPDDVFPNLEKLVLEGCCRLEEVPECLRYVDNLCAVEVIECRARVRRLLEDAVEAQKERGNSSLRYHATYCTCCTNYENELSGDESKSKYRRYSIL